MGARAFRILWICEGNSGAFLFPIILIEKVKEILQTNFHAPQTATVGCCQGRGESLRIINSVSKNSRENCSWQLKPITV